MADRSQPMQHWTPDGKPAPQPIGTNSGVRPSDMTRPPNASQPAAPLRAAGPHRDILSLEDQLAAALQAAECEVRQAPIFTAEPAPLAAGTEFAGTPLEPPPMESDLAAPAGLYETPVEPCSNPPPHIGVAFHAESPQPAPRPEGQETGAPRPVRSLRLPELFRSSLVPVVSLVLLLASGAVVLAYLGTGPSTSVDPALVTESETAKPFGERLASTHEKTETEVSPAALATEGAAPGVADGIVMAGAPDVANTPAQIESDPFGMAATVPAEPDASPSAEAGFASPMDEQTVEVQTVQADPQPEAQAAFPAEQETFAASDDIPSVATADPVAEAEAISGEGRTETVNTHVNMRSEPDNDAAVVAVVPAEKQVQIVSCDYWCEVVFEGQRGWIYKSFVNGL
jgi:hypothetical protein